MSDSVEKHRIGYSALTNSIYLYRHGKDQHTALSKREAEPEVVSAVIQRVLADGGELNVSFGDRKFVITVKEAE